MNNKEINRLTVVDGKLDDLNGFSAQDELRAVALLGAVHFQAIWWNLLGTPRVIVAVTLVALDRFT